jgi:cephalosporin hydroxylase
MRYPYVWRWLGVPIIQMPADVVVLQEIVWAAKPQLIVETGVARGGSLLFFSSLLELLGEGEVVGIDVDVRPHNRKSIEEQPLSKRISLVEGSSVDAAVVAEVAGRASEVDRVMVVLDSHHSHEHVLSEMRLYAPMVSIGQFLVVSDTIIEDLPAPADGRWGPGDSPRTAVEAFLADDHRFEADSYLNSKLLMSCSRGGYLRRVRQ